jgi:hypothetical protein
MSHNVFISHRHSDKDIAESIRYHLGLWGIPGTEVILSSDVRGDLDPKEVLTTLRKVLWETKFLILVYTFPDQDWSWCMWECGVATNPGHDLSRMVVFQCGPDKLPTIINENIVSLSEQSIFDFVSSFFLQPDFFQGEHHIGHT